MTKHELLVPAGDMASLYQAIANGADAVYLGCKCFGARKFAKNFDNEEILQALKYAHLYGVKVYVTMNTLVKDEEVDDFLAQVEFLHRHKVDAILIQDFGMLCLVRERYPDLEVHASTQANTSSKDTARLFHKLGIKRVVFSREMTLEEIKSIDVPIEKEVFIHGALCICYSGCCLMSSMLGTRSGNRGECAGSCRLPYTLKRNGEVISKKAYLLSTKELNSASHIQELLASDIASFKVEGRMKSPEYVGFITRYYRNLIDGKTVDLKEETDKLKTIFNRNFTSGNLFSTPSIELMNIKTPNHIGLEIGKVVEITKDKIKIKLTKPLNQHDGIRFLNSGKGFIVNYLYDKKDNLINHAEDICYVDNKINLEIMDTVCKTQDYNLLASLATIPERKVNVKFNIFAHIGKHLEITITDGTTSIKELGTEVAASINAPMTKDRIVKQIEKLGTTPFKSTETIISADNNIFISVKELNEIRRQLIEKLIAKRTELDQEIKVNEVQFMPSTFEEKFGLTATVKNEEQLLTCLDLNFKYIYISNKDLYMKYQDNSKIYYQIPRCTRNIEGNSSNKNYLSDYCVPSKDKIYRGNYPLNVSNIYTIYYLHKLNIKSVMPSVELSDSEKLSLIKKYQTKFKTTANIELFTYGRIENMLIKGNVLGLEEDSTDYSLIDFKERLFPVYYDGLNTHILNYEYFQTEDKLLLNNVSSLHFDFSCEDRKIIEKIVNNY